MQYEFIPPLSKAQIRIIGLCGGTASGKGAVLDQIIAKMNSLSKKGSSRKSAQVIVIETDRYYKNLGKNEDPTKKNFDEVDAIDIDEIYNHVVSLKKGDEILVPNYNFSTHERSKNHTTIEINRFSDNVVIIIEGIHAFDKKLCDLYDYKIWIEASDKIRLERRINRDTVSRGRTVKSVQDQWDATVNPTFHKYYKEYKKTADFIIKNEGSDFKNLKKKITLISKWILEIDSQPPHTKKFLRRRVKSAVNLV